MVKHQVVVMAFIRMGKTPPVTEALRVTHLHDPGFSISSEEDILLIIQTGEAILNNSHKPASFVTSSSKRGGRVLLVVLHAHHLEHDKGKFPTFALFRDTKIKQMKISHYSVMSLFISAMRSFDYATRGKFKKCEVKAEICGERLLLKVWR